MDHNLPPRPRILICYPPGQTNQAHQMIFDLYGHPGWFRSITEAEMTTTRAVEFLFDETDGPFDAILTITSGVYGSPPTISQ